MSQKFAALPAASRTILLRFIFPSILILSVFSFTSAAFPQQKPSPAEQLLFDSVNRERAAANLSPLQWDSSLAAAARLHAQRMQDADNLSHQLPREPDLKTRAAEAGASFSKVAENIARGQVAGEIHAEWMHSPGHRGNILDPQVNAIGISVVQRKEVLFAVEDFSRAVTALSLPQQEARVAELLRATGLKISGDFASARKSCESDKFLTERRPVFIARFQTSDLSRLPEQLQHRIRSGGYRSAAVGACELPDASAFTQFRVAVLLFGGR